MSLFRKSNDKEYKVVLNKKSPLIGESKEDIAFADTREEAEEIAADFDQKKRSSSVTIEKNDQIDVLLRPKGRRFLKAHRFSSCS
jgi:hypothetical protein